MSGHVAVLEHLLARMGAAFRLTRLYPSTHPAVAEAVAQMGAALVAAASALPVDLRTGPHAAGGGTAPAGGAPGTVPAELGALLFTHGVRMVTLGRGTATDHVLALFSVATGVLQLDDAALGPVVLSRVARRSVQRPALDPSAETAPSGGLELPRHRPSGAVFRPDALPVDIAARRGIQAARGARDTAAREAAAAQLAPVVPDLLARRDAGLAADAIVALDTARQGVPGAVGPSFARAMAALEGVDVVALLLERLADAHAQPEERDLVARALGVLVEVAAGPIVEAYLAAPPEGREPFRDAFRQAGARAVAPLEPYLADPRPAVLAAAVEFVGLAGGPRVADLLTPRTREGNARVREAAFLGLARAGGRPLARVAVPALRDPDPAVRAAAARAVAAAGDASAVTVLARRADEEEDEGALAEVLRAIARLGGAAALEVLTRFAQPGTLLRRRSPFIRGAAVAALGEMPGPEARALVEHYSHDREPAVRRAAQAAMTQ